MRAAGIGRDTRHRRRCDGLFDVGVGLSAEAATASQDAQAGHDDGRPPRSSHRSLLPVRVRPRRTEDVDAAGGIVAVVARRVRFVARYGVRVPDPTTNSSSSTVNVSAPLATKPTCSWGWLCSGTAAPGSK